MSDKKYRLRVDIRKEGGGGEYYGEQKYTKAGTARGIATELVARAQSEPFIALDNGTFIRSTDIVAVWVETIVEKTAKAGY